MKTFKVYVREVWVQPVEVEAEHFEQAKERVADGEGIVLGNELEYVEPLPVDSWGGYDEGGNWLEPVTV